MRPGDMQRSTLSCFCNDIELSQFARRRFVTGLSFCGLGRPVLYQLALWLRE